MMFCTNNCSTLSLTNTGCVWGFYGSQKEPGQINADVEMSMDTREMSSQEQEGLAGDVASELGESNEAMQEGISQPESHHSENDPLYVQKRLKRQQRAHEREMREMREAMSHMQQQSQQAPRHQETGSYGNPEMDHDDERIHRAVSYALQHKEMEERKAREAEQMQHVHRKYQDLSSHLDHMADKYDDFDDLVRGHDAPFTSQLRDAALLLPKSGPGSAGEVLYKLGKNKEDLERISKLHPLDQVSEMVKLSHALISGGGSPGSQQTSRPLGNIKNNPVSNSGGVTEKTSVGELRKRMRAGWK
jgi:hypothetical protein